MKRQQIISLVLFTVLVTLATVSADCTSNPCKNGECKNDTAAPGYVCKCRTGYEGATCDKEIDECTLNMGVCKNNGTCLDAIGYYLCSCTEDWKGENCTITKITSPCIPNPCSHGAKCNATSRKEYTCDCGTFWRGKNCHTHEVALVIMSVTIIIVVIVIVFMLYNLCKDYRRRHPEQFVRKGDDLS